MFIQVFNKIYTYIQEIQNKNEVYTEKSQNPFTFSNFKLWEQAESYISTYIKEEVDKLVEGRQEVIYTNRETMIFSRVNTEIDQVLEGLVYFLNKHDEMEVSICDRAYLECKLYNDIEEEIIAQAIQKTFIKKDKWMGLDYYLFTKRLKYVVNQGERVILTELQTRLLSKNGQYVS